jgi:hypothetical protein
VIPQFANPSEEFKRRNPHLFGVAGAVVRPAAPVDLKSERQLQGQLVNLLRLRGIEPLWHRTDKRSAATVGWPDITASIKGTPVLWEVKLDGAKLSEEQQALRPRLIENGWDYYVVTSVDEALQILRRYGIS